MGKGISTLVEVVGRSKEVAALDRFLASVGRGFGVLAIEGEAGIGKTTVWREGVRQAGERGATVLVARATEQELGLSFAGLADLFGPLGDELLEGLPAPQRDALWTALLKAPLSDRGVDERAVSASVLSVLRLLSAQGQVVVAVDDAQWLDSPSARALAFAVRRLDTEAVGVLATVGTGGGAVDSFDRAADPAKRTEVMLGPLSVAALHELIKGNLGVAYSRPVIVRIAEASGGNPFYALEIAAELAHHRAGRDRLQVPASLAGLLEGRIAGLPERTQEALLVCALLSCPTPEQVDVEAVEGAEAARIVSIERDRIRFSHPLLASAVCNRVPPAERRRVHRKLAELALGPEERARHLALGSVRPDEAIARELDAAAELAGLRGAPQVAAELTELALDLTAATNEAARMARSFSAARFWFDAGDLARSEETIRSVLALLPGGKLRVDTLALLGQLHARRNSFAQALAAATQALEWAGPDGLVRGAIELDLSYYLVNLGDFVGARQHAQAAVQAMEATETCGALADGLAVLTTCEFACGGGFDEDRMATALELEDTRRQRTWQMCPSFHRGLLLLWSDRPDEAVSVLGGLRTATLERGQESHVPFLWFFLLWAQLWRGDLAAAARLAQEARDAAALLGDPASVGIALTGEALVHAHDGSVALACDQAREAIACFEGLGWQVGTIWPLWALGLAQLGSGDPAAVDATLGALADMLPGTAGDPSLQGVFLPDEIEALVELGQLDRAERLLDWYEGRGAELRRVWALASAGRCRALLLAARGDGDHALEVVEAALATDGRTAMPFDRARTLLVQGRLLRRMGRRRRAHESLGEAAQVFDRIGACGWSERVQAELARLGAKRASWDRLTPTESVVAELAASGASNAEIAARAFLTVKAVEANLTRVYRKLAIRSRGGLAQALQASRQALK